VKPWSSYRLLRPSRKAGSFMRWRHNFCDEAARTRVAGSDDVRRKTWLLLVLHGGAPSSGKLSERRVCLHYIWAE
jgi:hypothetical protein